MYSNHDKLFQNAFQFAAIGMALVGLDGRWLKVNRSLCELVGYTEEELLCLSFQGITHPDDLEQDLSFVAQLLEGQRSAYQMEKRYFHKDGRIIWVLLHVGIVRDEGGKPQAFISQIIDITARKVAEEELERSARANQRLIAELRERNSQIELLRGQLLTVCAWTKQIFYDGQWMTVDRFLGDYLHLNLTHTISEEAYKQVVAEVEAATKRKALG